MTVKINFDWKARRSWRHGFFAATGLSLFAVLSSMLWEAGYPEWAFVLSFLVLWILLTLFWSNDDFNEESGLILAQIVDENLEDIHHRLQEIEEKVADSPEGTTQAA
jgi:hypothetical protein